MKKQFARYFDADDDQLAPWIQFCFLFGALLVLSAFLVLILDAVLPEFNQARGSTVCLTKREARVLWPKRHIFWYGPQHCWSNRRGGPPTGIKVDPIKNSHAESLPANSEDAGKADRAKPPENPRAVRIIPITKQTEWVNDFQDYCCWPPLEEATDIDRDRENAFRLLAEKMRKQK